MRIIISSLLFIIILVSNVYGTNYVTNRTDITISNGFIGNSSDNRRVISSIGQPLSKHIEYGNYTVNYGFMRNKAIVSSNISIFWQIWNGTQWANAEDYFVEFSCRINERNCEPQDQNRTQPTFKMTNNGNVNINNVTMNMNATCPRIILRAYDTYNSTLAVNMTTIYNRVMFNITTLNQNSIMYLWLFGDYYNPTTSCGDWPLLSLNYTS